MVREAVRIIVFTCEISAHELSSRLVAPFVNKLPATVKVVTEILRPEIKRRQALMAEYGKEYPGKSVRRS